MHFCLVSERLKAQVVVAVHGVRHCVGDGPLQVRAVAEVAPGVILGLLLHLKKNSFA